MGKKSRRIRNKSKISERNQERSGSTILASNDPDRNDIVRVPASRTATRRQPNKRNDSTIASTGSKKDSDNSNIDSLPASAPTATAAPSIQGISPRPNFTRHLLLDDVEKGFQIWACRGNYPNVQITDEIVDLKADSLRRKLQLDLLPQKYREMAEDFLMTSSGNIIYSRRKYTGKTEFIAFGVPSKNKTEFIAFGVPSNNIHYVVELIVAFSFRTVSELQEKPVYYAPRSMDCVTTLIVRPKLIERGPRKDELLTTHGVGCQTILFELVPLFKRKHCPDYWGGRKPAPEGREDIVDAILKIWDDQFWQRQKSFRLFIDGNRSNKNCTNTKIIDLSTSLTNLDWEVDWDEDLTLEKSSFVRKHNRYFSQLCKVLFRGPKKCGYCHIIDNQKLVRCLCKQVWYCCPSCQVADWSEHKKFCKEMRTHFDNKPINSCAHCGIKDYEQKLACCSRCQNSWYCCEDHQKADWPLHKQRCEQKILIVD